MSAALYVLGAVLLLAGATVAGATRSVRDGMLLQALGATLLGIAGGLVLWSGHALGSRFANGIDPSLGVHRLSGVFLLMLGIASGPVLVFAAGYLDASARGRAVGALTGVFVGVLVLMLCARDIVTFLGAWELMTLVPAAIVLIWRNEEPARRGVFIYVAVTHLAGAGARVALLVLARYGALGGNALDGYITMPRRIGARQTGRCALPKRVEPRWRPAALGLVPVVMLVICDSPVPFPLRRVLPRRARGLFPRPPRTRLVATVSLDLHRTVNEACWPAW
jgi:hypothetical protein